VTVGVEPTAAFLWNERGDRVCELEGVHGEVRTLVFSREGDRLLLGFADNKACIWDSDGRPIATLPHTASVQQCWSIANEGGFVTGCEDGTIRHFSRDGSLRACIPGPRLEPTGLHATSDGSWLVVGGNDRVARLWPLKRDELLRIARARAPRDYTDEERERYNGLLGK